MNSELSVVTSRPVADAFTYVTDSRYHSYPRPAPTAVPPTQAPAPAADDIQTGESICLQFRP